MITEEGIEEILNMLHRAGKVIMHYYKNDEKSLDTQLKKDNTPVTIADTASNEIIYNFLKTTYPDIPIISEETEIDGYDTRCQWEYVWLIDPLDGTKEFLNKTDEFAINLALVRNEQSILGFIYLPVFERMYYAYKGQGAFEITNGVKTQISVSSFNLQQKGLKVVASRSYMDPNTSSYIDVLDDPEMIKLGSSLKFVSIAKGESDYYPRMIHIMEWDTAAGQIIIEEAGGSLVDSHTGLPLAYNKSTMVNPTFIASGKISS
jgi:3'(2'), 5'-bisphosphate nucleotidase